MINQLSRSSFSSKSSEHLKSQSIRARDLNFWHNFHHLSCVMCHVSHVMCHMLCVTCHLSYVTCHMSPVTCHIYVYINIYIYFFAFLQIFGATRWRVCYKQGPPCLVSLGPARALVVGPFKDRSELYKTNVQKSKSFSLRPHFCVCFFCLLYRLKTIILALLSESAHIRAYKSTYNSHFICNCIY